MDRQRGDEPIYQPILRPTGDEPIYRIEENIRPIGDEPNIPTNI